jgi:hypothetical protein
LKEGGRWCGKAGRAGKQASKQADRAAERSIPKARPSTRTYGSSPLQQCVWKSRFSVDGFHFCSRSRARPGQAVRLACQTALKLLPNHPRACMALVGEKRRPHEAASATGKTDVSFSAAALCTIQLLLYQRRYCS